VRWKRSEEHRLRFILQSSRIFKLKFRPLHFSHSDHHSARGQQRGRWRLPPSGTCGVYQRRQIYLTRLRFLVTLLHLFSCTDCFCFFETVILFSFYRFRGLAAVSPSDQQARLLLESIKWRPRRLLRRKSEQLSG